MQQQSYAAAVTDGDPPQRVVKVAAGSFHTVALTADGLVFAWGDNRMNQLGLDPLVARGNPCYTILYNTILYTCIDIHI